MAGEIDPSGAQDARAISIRASAPCLYIIASFSSTRGVVSDLIAIMAQTLAKRHHQALTQTPVWTAYTE